MKVPFIFFLFSFYLFLFILFYFILFSGFSCKCGLAGLAEGVFESIAAYREV